MPAYRSAARVTPHCALSPARPARMRVTSATAVVIAALLTSAAPTAAQATGSIELGMYGQVTRVEPEQARFETRTPLSLGIRGRVNLSRQIGVELEASTGIVDGAGDPPQRRYNQLVARGTYTLPLSEFSGLLLGAGLARSDYEVTYNFGASGLVGIRTVISGRYALRSDLIFNYLPTSGARELGLRTGVQRVLGPFDGPTTADRARRRLTMQEPGTIETGLFAQQWKLNPVWNLASGRALGMRVGTFVTSRSTLEVESTYGRQAVRADGGLSSTGFPMRGGNTYRVTTFAMRYAHTIPVGARYGLLAGFGPARSSYEYIDYWGVSGVAGGRMALTRDLQLRGDLVANFLPGERVVDVGARIGLSTLLRLGKE